jgi:hypothetical protein
VAYSLPLSCVTQGGVGSFEIQRLTPRSGAEVVDLEMMILSQMYTELLDALISNSVGFEMSAR